MVFSHRPFSDTPIEEVVRAFNWVIERGLALYWATSEWEPSRIVQAIEVAKRLNMIAPIAEQSEYNMLKRSSLE